MKLKRTFIAGLVGGSAFFVLGWLLYGLILANYMAGHSNPAIIRPLSEIKWWAIVLSNLGWGFLLTIVFDWCKVNSLIFGIRRGSILGFILAFSLDSGFYGMYTMYSYFTPVIVDILGSVIIFAIVGGVIGWILGRSDRT